MFNDIGKKIMNYMKTICVIAIICIIISLIFDIISIASMHSSQLEAKYGANDAATPIQSSIFTHLLTAAGIYVGSWVLYAFGQLVDDVHAMRMKETSATSIEEDKKSVDAGIVPIRETKKVQEAKSVPVKPVSNVGTENAKNQGSESTKVPQLLDKDNWKCSCGRTNPYYFVTCVCGKKKEKVE